ncbi:nuclear transport factor 2 family protein [Seonamhaeicola marinus]|uniref:Nuclear transport factor 2 family protein n=1 Tax=Seonamhaeicola marinus TaxID=1912246 RepID=A0A5D0HN83_9FLAO|nr:nuclear transport factor 2 family protein [Seonamhaeicola marinus]TYA71507.1 nuclear transport factor 2 family protein [Seonamhaeicola marinus]
MKLLRLSFLLFSISLFSQNTELKAINSQLWTNFTKAYELLDYNLFASIHANDLVRVSGNSKTISNKTTYIDKYIKWWTDNDRKQTISFRFLERIVSNNKASERGIYKLTIGPNTQNEKSYYGKFHVILTKENSIWKILVDYDSSENDTIDETSYLNAFAIDDFEKF